MLRLMQGRLIMHRNNKKPWRIATVSISEDTLHAMIFEKHEHHFNAIAQQKYTLPTGTLNGIRINGIYTIAHAYKNFIAQYGSHGIDSAFAIENPNHEAQHIQIDQTHNDIDMCADTMLRTELFSFNHAHHALRCHYTYVDWFIYQTLKNALYPQPLVITLSLYATLYGLPAHKNDSMINGQLLSKDVIVTIARAQKKPYGKVEQQYNVCDEYTLLTHEGLALMALDAYEYIKFY